MRRSDTIAAEVLERVPRGVDAGAWRRGDSTVVGVLAAEIVAGQGQEALRRLDDLAPGTWLGWLAFELGHAIEPVRPSHASAEPAAVPDVVFVRFAAHAVVGRDGSMTVFGDGSGRAILDAAVADVAASGAPSPGPASPDADRVTGSRCAEARWRSSLDRGDFEARVAVIGDLLRAGECYQVNLTRRLVRDEPTDAVSLYRRVAHRHPAPFTGMLRVQLDAFGDAAVRDGAVRDPAVDEVAVVCASPERFLRVQGDRVETKPIKGTAVDAHALRASAKDHAENVMIVDLARNDLGRVCEPGTVEVPSLFAVESHPGLHHLVSTVVGRRRDDVGLAALVAATFPPASVTGAPKPRVLQAIEDLEPVRRGVYCGAFGWIDTEHDQADLAVAIRTFALFPDRTELGVGAGIVADSSPSEEWAETELKASRLVSLARSDVLAAR